MQPGTLIDGEYAPDDGRILVGKLRTHVQCAPAIEGGIAVEEPGAVLDLGGGHHWVEASPGIDVAPDQGGFAVGMLQQDELHVGRGKASRPECPG